MILTLASSTGWAYYKGFTKGKQVVKLEMALKEQEVKEELDEVRNRDVTDDVVLKRLHNGTF